MCVYVLHIESYLGDGIMFHFLFNINFLKGGNQEKGFEKQINEMTA